MQNAILLWMVPKILIESGEFLAENGEIRYCLYKNSERELSPEVHCIIGTAYGWLGPSLTLLLYLSLIWKRNLFTI